VSFRENRLRLPKAVLLALMPAMPALAQQAAPDTSTPAETGARSDTAGKSATELAKELQNPVADLISVPFQNNTNFDFGPLHGTQDILNIQPVVPFHLNQDWNLITRTIMPVT
jgi:hypothetical protein